MLAPATSLHRVVHVLAGVLLDTSGRVLLAQRPPGKHLAGQWEFPGGKREAGESPLQALTRELAEELGIVVQHAEPLIALPWHYDANELLLDAWHVLQWAGTPILTAADRLVLAALLQTR